MQRLVACSHRCRCGTTARSCANTPPLVFSCCECKLFIGTWSTAVTDLFAFGICGGSCSDVEAMNADGHDFAFRKDAFAASYVICCISCEQSKRASIRWACIAMKWNISQHKHIVFVALRSFALSSRQIQNSGMMIKDSCEFQVYSSSLNAKDEVNEIVCLIRGHLAFGFCKHAIPQYL